VGLATLTNSVVLVSKRTIPTELPSIVGEASANFCGFTVKNQSVRKINRASDLDGFKRSKRRNVDMKFGTWHMAHGMILERWDGLMWTGLVWLRIGTGGELL
jgi:hypothetical protein